MIDGKVKEAKELLEGCVIHPVDECHFDYAEIENRASGSYHPELLSLLVDFNPLLFGLKQLLTNFL